MASPNIRGNGTDVESLFPARVAAFRADEQEAREWANEPRGGMYLHADEGSRFLRLALAEVDHLRAERDLVYAELNRALGEHAPKAWDRIKAALGA
jgi:hypothetical protein